MWSLVRKFSEHDVTFSHYIKYRYDQKQRCTINYWSVFLHMTKFWLSWGKKSSLLTGRSICLSWIVFFCSSVKYIVKFSDIVHVTLNKTQSTCFFFAKQVNKRTYFFWWKRSCYRVWNSFLSILEKHHHFLRRGPWSVTYDPGELKFLKAD